MSNPGADVAGLPAAAYDPYDLWATSAGVAARRLYYQRRLLGLPAAAAIGAVDWLAPQLARRMLGISRQRYPISLALQLLARMQRAALSDAVAEQALQEFDRLAWRRDDALAWGLGFRWMSKNGLYDPKVPFVTHTPYVMEMLLAFAASSGVRTEAMQRFHATWGFLQSLQTMHRSDTELALSYAPMAEPRIVVNANAYAAFAYALHATHGVDERREMARQKAARLVRWVLAQQQSCGRWMYYADDDSGNFCDAFHTGFVLKNLIKTAQHIDYGDTSLSGAVDRGARYLREAFVDEPTGLVRRFVVRDIKDPYRWDLYDQAEYLGVLLDTNQGDAAAAFARTVSDRFSRGTDWFCRIDLLGRCWGRNFVRWGIAPWQYQVARLAAHDQGAN